MELEQNGNYEKGYFNGISDILRDRKLNCVSVLL